MELLVLALLQESNLYGYQISQLVKERSGNILTIPEGSM
ncbi:MAG: PadR family transcriptional regulator, partial [Roseburia sp.]|nr:PadR family transcriptional regulator [Roseburia sp.]